MTAGQCAILGAPHPPWPGEPQRSWPCGIFQSLRCAACYIKHICSSLQNASRNTNSDQCYFWWSMGYCHAMSSFRDHLSLSTSARSPSPRWFIFYFCVTYLSQITDQCTGAYVTWLSVPITGRASIKLTSANVLAEVRACIAMPGTSLIFRK